MTRKKVKINCTSTLNENWNLIYEAVGERAMRASNGKQNPRRPVVRGRSINTTTWEKHRRMRRGQRRDEVIRQTDQRLEEREREGGKGKEKENQWMLGKEKKGEQERRNEYRIRKGKGESPSRRTVFWWKHLRQSEKEDGRRGDEYNRRGKERHRQKNNNPNNKKKQ